MTQSRTHTNSKHTSMITPASIEWRQVTVAYKLIATSTVFSISLAELSKGINKRTIVCLSVKKLPVTELRTHASLSMWEVFKMDTPLDFTAES